MSSRRPPSKSTSKTNIYGKASGSYSAQGIKHAGSRDVEAQALLKAARKLQELQMAWDKRTNKVIEETLKYNRQIWVLFYDNAVNDAAANTQPEPLRNNIINLAGFVFKRSVDILADPDKDKLNILININREIAAGLMSKPVPQTSS